MKTAALIGILVGVIGCNKPSDEDCRKAIVNMQTLIGTDNQKGNDLEGEVRRCRGGSKKEAVACAIKATTLDELDACAFMTAPHKGKRDTGSAAPSTMTGSGSGSGSAAPAAGSGSGAAAPAAGSGSDPAAPATMTGSGSGSGSAAAGSGSGSAAAGSGSGSGSAAATTATGSGSSAK